MSRRWLLDGTAATALLNTEDVLARDAAYALMAARRSEVYILDLVLFNVFLFLVQDARGDVEAARSLLSTLEDVYEVRTREVTDICLLESAMLRQTADLSKSVDTASEAASYNKLLHCDYALNLACCELDHLTLVTADKTVHEMVPESHYIRTESR